MEFNEGRWILRGTVQEPLFSELIEQAGEMVLTGEVDTSGLKNGTELKLAMLRAKIEGVRLDFGPGEAEFSEESASGSERLIELIREFDGDTEKLGRLPASFVIHTDPEESEEEAGELEQKRIAAAEELLIERGDIPVERFLPGIVDSETSPGGPGVRIEIVETE